MKRILFLCSGNYYRSRFAEVYFNWEAQRRGMAWIAESRGLSLDERNSGPVSRHAIAALRARGVPPANCHRLPLAATETDFAAAQRIVAVKAAEHRPLIVAHYPSWCERVEYWHVDDVDCGRPEEAMRLLEQEILALLEQLASAAA